MHSELRRSMLMMARFARICFGIARGAADPPFASFSVSHSLHSDDLEIPPAAAGKLSRSE